MLNESFDLELPSLSQPHSSNSIRQKKNNNNNNSMSIASPRSNNANNHMKPNSPSIGKAHYVHQHNHAKRQFFSLKRNENQPGRYFSPELQNLEMPIVRDGICSGKVHARRLRDLERELTVDKRFPSGSFTSNYPSQISSAKEKLLQRIHNQNRFGKHGIAGYNVKQQNNNQQLIIKQQQQQQQQLDQLNSNLMNINNNNSNNSIIRAKWPSPTGSSANLPSFSIGLSNPGLISTAPTTISPIDQFDPTEYTYKPKAFNRQELLHLDSLKNYGSSKNGLPISNISPQHYSPVGKAPQAAITTSGVANSSAIVQSTCFNLDMNRWAGKQQQEYNQSQFQLQANAHNSSTAPTNKKRTISNTNSMHNDSIASIMSSAKGSCSYNNRRKSGSGYSGDIIAAAAAAVGAENESQTYFIEPPISIHRGSPKKGGNNRLAPLRSPQNSPNSKRTLNRKISQISAENSVQLEKNGGGSPKIGSATTGYYSNNNGNSNNDFALYKSDKLSVPTPQIYKALDILDKQNLGGVGSIADQRSKLGASQPQIKIDDGFGDHILKYHHVKTRIVENLVPFKVISKPDQLPMLTSYSQIPEAEQQLHLHIHLKQQQ